MSGDARRNPAGHRRLLWRLPVRVVTTALLVRLLDEWWSYLPAGAVGDLRADLGISYAQAGWLLGLLSVGGLLGGPLGALADHAARRPMAVAGAATLTGGLAVYAAGAPFPLLAAASFCMGAASDLMIRPLEVSLAETAGDRLDRLLGRQHLLSWAGDLAGPALLAAGASTTLGWRGAFGVTAAVMGTYGVMIAATELPAPSPAADRRRGTVRTAASDALALCRHREVLLLACAEGLMIVLDEAFLGFAVARLVAAGAGGEAQVLAVGLFLGGVAGSGWVDRAGLTPGIRRAGPPLLVAGAVGVAAGPPRAVQLAAMTAMGLGTALVWARVRHRTLTVIPGRAATVSSLVGTFSGVAAIVPPAVGLLADRVGLTAGLVALALCAVPLWAVVAALGGDDPVRTDRGR